ncbi:MAG: hypothetical protein FWH28_07350 [Clostridiales bacterium]|nr:hypothetical protein [Clostridiales bacterium]
MQEPKNVLAQKNKMKWKEHPPKVEREQVAAAFACAAAAENMSCDCWHTACQYYGNCRACLVFHLYLNQLPTCQRDAFEGLEELYIAKTTGK